MINVLSKLFHRHQKKIKYGVLTYLSVDGKALMMRKGIRENDPNSGHYTPSGGNLESYEKGLSNPNGRLEAAVREPLEESGLTCLHPTYRGMILFDNDGRIFKNWKKPDDFLVYVYSSSQYVGELSEGKNGESPVWVDVKDIPSLPKNVGDELIYEWLRDGRFFMGIIKHKGKELDKEGTWVDFN
jgi:8-oxo-dGTP pyrophosphatase MutT (NUDIX family)